MTLKELRSRFKGELITHEKWDFSDDPVKKFSFSHFSDEYVKWLENKLIEKSKSKQHKEYKSCDNCDSYHSCHGYMGPDDIPRNRHVKLCENWRKRNK